MLLFRVLPLEIDIFYVFFIYQSLIYLLSSEHKTCTPSPVRYVVHMALLAKVNLLYNLIFSFVIYIHSVTIPTSVARKWIGARVTPQFQLELPELETLMPGGRVFHGNQLIVSSLVKRP